VHICEYEALLFASAKMLRANGRSKLKNALPSHRTRFQSTLTAPLPESIASSSTLTGLSDLFLKLPELLPGNASYTACIVALCLTLRFGVTLPVAIWQRKRTDRLHKIVGPLMHDWAMNERYALRVRFRPLGKSYEEYQKEFKRLVSASFRANRQADLFE
jgi:hypothetical protein